MIDIIPFSGGIDSTYLLWRRLKETGSDVLALHVRMGNIEGRQKAEQHAVELILKRLKSDNRAFRYEETTLDRRMLSSFGLDVLTVASHVGAICRGLTAKEGIWMLGMCLEEQGERTADPEADDRRERPHSSLGYETPAAYAAELERQWPAPLRPKGSATQAIASTAPMRKKTAWL